MKKFLTVLLVIAVMFTFSFGSAFAATDAEKAAALRSARDVAVKVVNDNFDAAMKIVLADDLGYSAATASEREDAWGKIDAKAAILAEIDRLYAVEAAACGNYDADVNKYAANVFKFTGKANAALSITDDQGAPVTTTVLVNNLANAIMDVSGLEVVYNLYVADRTELFSAYDKVDWSAYSTDVNPKDPEKRTYLEIAQDRIADAKEAAEDVWNIKLSQLVWTGADYTTTYPTSTLATIIADSRPAYIPAIVGTVVTKQTVTVDNIPYETGLYLVVGVPTKDAVDADNAVDNATIASYKAAAASAYAQFIKDNGNSHKSFADAWLKVVNFLADAKMLEAAPAYDDTNDLLMDGATSQATIALNGTADKAYVDAVEVIESLEAYAAKYKGEKDETGALVRKAEDVDAIVEEYTSYLYGTTHNLKTATTDKVKTYDTLAKAKEAIVACSIDSDAQELAFAKELAKTLLADLLDEIKDNYYPLELEIVNKNYEDGLAKIEAATTPAKVKAAYEAVDTAAELGKGAKDTDDVDALCDFTKAGSPEKAAFDAVKAYVTYANTPYTILNDEYIVGSDADIKDAIEAIYGKAGARTSAERKAVTVDAATVAAELSTVGKLAAAKTAAEDAIKALPTTITVADKDAVVAAFGLAGDYKDMTGAGALTNQDKLTKAVTDLAAALKLDLSKKIAAVDKTDKAALKALAEEIDAANNTITEDLELAASNKVNTTVVDDAIKAIRAKELAAVIAAINALPVNITEADKAQVEAARKVYDTFVEEWTEYNAFDDDYNAAAKVTNFRELALAEAALGLNAEDPALSVESLKLTASSTAAKGSITVKWKVNGDTSAVEGYEIWKSTKRSSGFKKAFTQTASKKTYKNTKGLKKGTRYYYKVRAIAYTADGVKVKSDWSNKAYRIAK